MNIKMHGKKVKAIYFGSGGVKLAAVPGVLGLTLSATYHGDRDEFWIVQTNAEGKEESRHNPRHLETIVWEEPDEHSAS